MHFLSRVTTVNPPPPSLALSPLIHPLSHSSQAHSAQSVRRLRLTHALAHWRAFSSHSLQRETQRRAALRFYYRSRLSAALHHWRAALANLQQHRITLDDLHAREVVRPRLRDAFAHWLAAARLLQARAVGHRCERANNSHHRESKYS